MITWREFLELKENDELPKLDLQVAKKLNRTIGDTLQKTVNPLDKVREDGPKSNKFVARTLNKAASEPDIKAADIEKKVGIPADNAPKMMKKK